MMKKIGLLQLLVGSDKQANISNAVKKIGECARAGAQIVCLPEMFNCPYSNDSFLPYSEAIPAGETTRALLKVASDHKIYVIGGSIPERDPSSGKIYNTCVVVNPAGEMIAKHRKIHLFDIDIPGKMTFKESETLTAGDDVTVFNVDGIGKVGLGICYDIRFPELAMRMRKEGCKLLIYPGAFNTTTGPLHWELLARARAVDNQCYVAVVSPARNPESKYLLFHLFFFFSSFNSIYRFLLLSFSLYLSVSYILIFVRFFAIQPFF